MSIVVLGLASGDIALSVSTVWNFPNIALAVSIITHAIVTPMYVCRAVYAWRASLPIRSSQPHIVPQAHNIIGKEGSVYL